MRIQSWLDVRDDMTLPNRWDALLIPLVIAILFLVAWGIHQMGTPYKVGQVLHVSLDPRNLPAYALRTSLRMAAGLILSLLFTFTYGTLAAKSMRAGQILVPLLDILQSVPILGFLSITVTGFIRLFQGSLLGPEAACIFAVFTSQAWNMTFSFYQSLRMVPDELKQAARLFRLSPWQRFWKLEAAYAMPGLLWNTMMSVAGGWFFVVASEAITVSGQTITLPGIGSYIALAIDQRNLAAIGYAVLTMLVVIVLTDQLFFRPLLAWAEKFKFEQSEATEAPASWLLTLIQRTHWTRSIIDRMGRLWDLSVRLFQWIPTLQLYQMRQQRQKKSAGWTHRAWAIGIPATGALIMVGIGRFIIGQVGWQEVGHVFLLGLYTASRVIILVGLATLVWVPISVRIGLKPRWASRVQPVILFLAAFPANLLFPIAVDAIVAWKLNPDIWLSPLIILGTQWYIVFNVIGGAASIPNDLKEAASNLGLPRALRWRALLLPGTLPSYVTGGITAFGGAWNASVVAEMVSWGKTTLTAHGLGSYIAQQTAAGDIHRIVLGVAVMSLYVILFNRMLWGRLYRYAENRLSLG